MNDWRKVKLAEVLNPVSRPVRVEPTATYSILGAHWYANGLYTKDVLPGAQIQANNLYRVKKGDFVYNRLFGWKGSFAVATNENDNCFVSNEFPCFDVKPDRADPQYIWRYFSLPRVWDEVLNLSTGGTPTSRNRLKEAQLLGMEIPMPSLREQRRIVAWIEKLAAMVNAARNLRKQSAEEADALFESALNKAWSGQENWNHKQLGQLAQTICGQVDPRIEPYASLPHINGEVIESGTCRLLPHYRLAKEDGITSGKYHFTPNSVLYSKIRPYLRKAVQVPFEGVCSADVYAFAKLDSEIDARFFMYSLIAPTFTKYVNTLSGRTRMPKVNQTQMFAFELAYPDLPEQRRIVTYLDNLRASVDTLKRSQVEISTQIEALMPSILDKAFRGEL